VFITVTTAAPQGQVKVILLMVVTLSL